MFMGTMDIPIMLAKDLQPKYTPRMAVVSEHGEEDDRGDAVSQDKNEYGRRLQDGEAQNCVPNRHSVPYVTTDKR